jgi:hypothetical protein
MSHLSLSSVAGFSASVAIALATAGALAQTGPTTPATTSTPSTKPLTPQGPLAAKPAPAVVSPDSKNLAARPLPVATTQAPTAPPPGGK